MPLPPLICPRDSSHGRFRGSVQAYTSYDVDVSSTRDILARSGPTDIAELSDVSDDAIFCAECGAQVWRQRKSVTFYPQEGTVLICNFGGGFRPPEMNKVRPVVIVSAKKRNREACLVVPISGTESRDRAIAVPLPASKYSFLERDSWAKCHSVCTVAKTRLYQLRAGRLGPGLDTRDTMIDDVDLLKIRRGVAAFAGVRYT